VTAGWSDGGVQHADRPRSSPDREALAHQVRRLIAAAVQSPAGPAALAAAAGALASVADDLEGAVAEGTDPTGRPTPDGARTDTAAGLAAAMPFDVVIGVSNPLALPITIAFEPPGAIGHAVFTAPYEGAPGCVHGAVLAGAFDIVLTAANVVGGSAGPTRTLTLRYLRPTLVNTVSRFEAWVTSIEGRRIRSSGRLVQGGLVTVEADGEFVTLDRPLAATGRSPVRSDGGPAIPYCGDGSGATAAR
jgi:hypothetical protein